MYRPDVKDSLCSFESIVGHEEHNPIDDSTLTAMFDDLQEGTLLSTLNNHVFHDLVTDSKGSWIAQDLEMSEMIEQSITGNFNLDNLFENASSRGSSSKVSNEETPTLSVSKSGMVMDDENEPSHLIPAVNICSSSMRETSSSPSSSKGDELSPTIDLQQQLDCIHHDHCYTMNVKEGDNKQSSCRSAYSSSSDSLEEGTNSDGGEVQKQVLICLYTTMHLWC